MSITSGIQKLMTSKPKFLPTEKKMFKGKKKRGAVKKKKRQRKKTKAVTEQTGERGLHKICNSTMTILSYKNNS